MTIGELPDQFEEFIDRARATLDREIAEAKSVVTAADAEKTSAANALSQLREQCKEAQNQLELSRREAQRMAGLVGVGREIDAARKELAKLRTEKAALELALEKLAKERSEREAQIVALGNEAQRHIAVRTEAETYMANIKAQLAQVQIGRSA